MQCKEGLLKRIFALFLALLVCVAGAQPAYAAEITEPIQCRVIQADTEEELFAAFENLDNDSVTPRSAVITVGIARNYSTGKSCEVYLNWKGTARYNGWRFKKLVISNGGSTTYGTIGTGNSYKTYNVISSSTGAVSLGTVQIPTSVSKVYVDFTSFQGSLSANSDWMSVVITDRSVYIV